MSKRNGNISPITFIDKVIKKNELGHPFQSVSVGAEVLAAAVNMCAVDQFEQGGCEAMINTLAAQGLEAGQG